MSYSTKTVLTIAAFLLAAGCHLVLTRITSKLGLVKENFKKKPIAASYGVYLLCYVLAGCGIAAVWGHRAGLSVFLPAILAMSALGFIDDVWGRRDVGGFGGHFKKLILERRVTTGVVKAIGGGLVSLFAGLFIAGWSLPEGFLNGAVIALSANTLNLLDLRPGRACAAFFVGLAAAFAASGFSFGAIGWLVLAVLVPAVVFYRWDSKALMMMGDSGSNMLGTVVGLAFTLETPVAARVVWLTLIVLLHLYSEKRSISGTIEQNALLRWIDRRLGER